MALTAAEQGKVLRQAADVLTTCKQNPEMAQALIAVILQDKGMADIIKGQAGPIAVENPQENWEKLLYVPTKFKTSTDENGNEIPLPEEDKRKQVWKTISFRNMLGDAVAALGGTGALLANKNAQQLQNNKSAQQLQSNAKGSASQAQRDLYGPTLSDRAAAASMPMFNALSGLSSLISGIVANRLYQSAGERKAAYLRALMAAEHNNMGTSGMYSDTWRKVQDPIPNMTNSVAGGPKK